MREVVTPGGQATDHGYRRDHRGHVGAVRGGQEDVSTRLRQPPQHHATCVHTGLTCRGVGRGVVVGDLTRHRDPLAG